MAWTKGPEPLLNLKQDESRTDDMQVLVVAPTGQDGVMICNLLTSRGIPCVNFPTAERARVELQAGAGAVVLAEEALAADDVVRWKAQIADQPSWSDLPMIVLTGAGKVDWENQVKLRLREPLGNLILLERPARPETLVSTVQAALRSRSRQYQMRDYLVERRKTEAALRLSEKLAVAGRLAASIAHEINNPLEAVFNLLYLISQSSSLEESKNYTQTALNEVERISEIVTQTLRFHREQVKPVMVQVPEIVDSALVLYHARLKSAQIVVERDFRECPPILASAGELRQVIVNLVANAADAMGRGGRLIIRVADTQEHRNGARRGIRLTIADTGSGIQPDIKGRLFEPFVSTKGNKGTGLGLWVSSEIVRRHGGTIQVKSSALSPDTGTVFSVFLPLQTQLASALD
jgi:signal transduction histidine kinase